MEGLRDKPFEVKYEVPNNDIVKEFIIPALKCAKQYDRATGFFSSDSLIRVTYGLAALAKNNGHIRLLTSPRLSLEDLESIKEGYDLKQVVTDSLIRDFTICSIENGSERLDLLANLIACGMLEIKVCFLKSYMKNGMFHPKFGIITDSDGDSIYFNGSMNETLNGQINNWEYIDVLTSWENKRNVKTNIETFNRIWNDKDPSLMVYDMPDVIKELILNYKTGRDDVYDLDESFMRGQKSSKFFIMPERIKLYDYQQEAITNWESQKFKGMFNMATGTGKTITALAALERLCNRLARGCFIFIVCPYQHLVEQWAMEIRNFEVQPIVGYSASDNKDWRTDLDRKIDLLNTETKNDKGHYQSFCFVTTNNTFRSKFVQEKIAKITGKCALVVDEVHNMGSEKSLRSLSEKFDYRLGLSATIERYNDPDGTKSLIDYFGDICIEYDLERAIKEKRLTPYYYYPILCVMKNEEYGRFTDLNSQLESILKTVKDISKKKNEIKKIKLVGARLVASIESKYHNLREIIKSEYIKDDLMLIYCGDARIDGELIDEEDVDDKIRLVELATRILGNDLGMNVERFTYRESMSDRRRIINDFQNKHIQALVAIRCLDEGVDIPAIKTAFITSSGNNPKEYIQRRGRVLRISSQTNKEYATIFDFITLPRKLDTIELKSPSNNFDIWFLAKEVRRMVEFSRICINPNDTKKIIDDLDETYGVSMKDILKEGGEEHGI